MMKLRFAYLPGLLAISLSTWAPNSCASAKQAGQWSDQVTVSDAVLIQAPPGAPVMGAYLTLLATQDDRLIGVSSSLSTDVQMHSMRDVDGTIQMRRVEFIELPAQQTVRLERGGLHLMVMEPFERPEVGSQVEFTLQFERAGGLRVNFDVRDGRVLDAAEGQGAHDHHRHHDH